MCMSNPAGFNGTMPPLDILVDFGDGTGARKWTTQHPVNVWQHRYSRPGTYTVQYHSTTDFQLANFLSLS